MAPFSRTRLTYKILELGPDRDADILIGGRSVSPLATSDIRIRDFSPACHLAGCDYLDDPLPFREPVLTSMSLGEISLAAVSVNRGVPTRNMVKRILEELIPNVDWTVPVNRLPPAESINFVSGVKDLLTTSFAAAEVSVADIKSQVAKDLRWVSNVTWPVVLRQSRVARAASLPRRANTPIAPRPPAAGVQLSRRERVARALSLPRPVVGGDEKQLAEGNVYPEAKQLPEANPPP